jgi:UDPglucose 6-dehydrogenase
MRIAVVGLGKLGLPMAVLYASAGYKVNGVDMDVKTVYEVNRRVYEGPEPGLQRELQKLAPSRLRAYSDYDRVAYADMSFVVVPTPSLPDGRFDSSHVVHAVSEIGKKLADTTKKHIVVVVSTVMPGDMRNAVQPALADALGFSNLDESNVRLVYSPEFVALGSVLQDMTAPHVVLLGGDDTLAMADVCAVIMSPITVQWDSLHLSMMSFENAEIAKLGLNASVVAKITMANVLTEICERFEGGNADDVLRFIGADPRIGHRYFAPGGPVGGPCFPRDVRALTRCSTDDDYVAGFLSSIDSERRWQIDRLVDMVDKTGLLRVGILGLAYKPGTTVTDDSLGAALTNMLCADPAVFDVLAYDPILTSPHAAQHCVGPDICTVVTTYDERWRDLDYTDAGVVIDVWGTLQAKIGEAPFYKRLGVN